VIAYAHTAIFAPVSEEGGVFGDDGHGLPFF
jgi:hypothetical protein